MCWHGAAEQETLHFVAVVAAQEVQLGQGFHALGDHCQIQAVGHGDDCPGNLRVLLAGRQAVDDDAAELFAIDRLDELRTLELGDDALEIGAALPLSELERRLDGRVPLLAQLLPQFASRLIRNRATLGGNLGTGSPIGDAPPALLALDARVVLHDSHMSEAELIFTALAELSTRQIATLSADQLAAMETQDFAALKTSQLLGLGTKDIATLTPAQVAALTTACNASFRAVTLANGRCVAARSGIHGECS